MITLRPYQDIAVTDLYAKANSLLAKTASKTLVFRAPTGSGKTIIMAEFLNKLVSENITGLNFSFIWAAPRQLHTQSKEKLEHYYHDNKTLKCSSFEDLTDKNIAENEILFLNWESINKKDNIYIRENENDFNLSSILQNTKDQGRQVILIIDESHYSTDTDKTTGLRDMISPKLTIEVSATPLFAGDELVPIDRENVIQDQMIKKYVVINPDFKNDIVAKNQDELSVKSKDETTREFIISEALKKRNQLSKQFSILPSNVNPLMLIQLPDKSATNDTIKDEITAILKNKHNITFENGKLAIWLSEEKQNRDTISLNDDKVEVMIFKQAIAIGWDCPRAHILLTFRDMHSPIFTIQTVGRILRMPELKHYPLESLNVGYIYTDMPAFTIKGDESFGYIVVQNAKRKNIYKNVDLPSVHSKRYREETRLSPKFISCFLKAAEELKLNHKIDRDVKEISITLISNGKIENIDEAKETKSIYSAEYVSLVQQEVEIQHLLELFITEHLPVFPEKRSVSRVKEAIYYFFKKSYPFKSIETDMQKIVLKESNKQHFIDAINKAKDLYDADVGKGKSTLIPDPPWNVPQDQSYNENYSKVKVNLSIVEPFYQRNDAMLPEKNFVSFLESKTKEIEWWYKNGENDALHFAVPYDDNGTPRSFYVDWIVKYKEGKIGLFDTKSGQTAETAKSKAEGLQAYIEKQNSKGKILFGGIVIQHSDSWLYNHNETYSFNKIDFKGWEYLP